MSLFIFLTVVQAIVAALLVAVILMQKSEGGGLGVGGNPSGLMSARGAADFLTRSTAVLATVFVVLSIALAAIAASTSSAGGPHTPLDRTVAPAGPPVSADPLAVPAAPAGAAPAAPASSADPLGAPAKQ